MRVRHEAFVVAVAAGLAALIGATPARAAFGWLGDIAPAGAGAGQVFSPMGIEADAAGNVYVADTGNLRVQKFDADGKFVRAWGWGVQDGAATFQICTSDCRAGIAGAGDGQFDKPNDIAVDGAGNVYVADTPGGGPDSGNQRVQKFDAQGSPVNDILDGNGIALNRNWWGTSGSGDGQFQKLLTIAAHTDTTSGETFVYTVDNERVQKFDAQGRFKGKWGTTGFGPGQFRGLGQIATDGAGDVYTLEFTNQRVQRFDKDGVFEFQYEVNPEGSQACFNGLAVDATGFAYVTLSCFEDGFRRFTPAGDRTDSLTCQVGVSAVGALPSGKILLGSGRGLLSYGEGGTASCLPPQPPPGGGGGGGPPPGGSGSGLSFGGAESITIEGGALYTNDAAVTLTIRAPAGAIDARISNDGGFKDPTGAGVCGNALPGTCVAPIAANGLYAWKLPRDIEANERIPKTVYVRFAGPTGVSPLTFSDDIILDTTNPTVSEATLSPASSGGGSGATASSARRSRFTLRVRGRDNASGVGKMQLAVKRSKPAKPIAYTRRLTITAARPPVYVRVLDRAGNRSKWRRIKTAKAR